MSYIGYKVILHPTSEQIDKIELQFKQVRYYWNLMVALNEYLYAHSLVEAGKELSTYEPKHGKSQQQFYDTYLNNADNKEVYELCTKVAPDRKHLSQFDMQKVMGAFRRADKTGLRGLGSDSQGKIASDLDKTYSAFFKDKTGKKGKPRFKRYFQSVGIGVSHLTNKQFKHTDNKWYTKLTNVGPVACSLTRSGLPKGKLKTGQINRTSTGQYTMSFSVQQQDHNTNFKRSKCVGIDLNVKGDSFMALSNGENLSYPQEWFIGMEAKLAKAQHKVDRRINHYKQEYAKDVAYFKSINQPECIPMYNPDSVSGVVKAKHYRAKLAKQIAGKRKAIIDGYTTMLTRKYNCIAIEDLKVANMVRNSHLSKSISRVAFSMVRLLLEQKSAKYNCEIIVVNPRNTSQTCNHCGYVLAGDEKLNLNIREWDCPNCGIHNIRDTNAAKNILKKAIDNSAK